MITSGLRTPPHTHRFSGGVFGDIFTMQIIASYKNIIEALFEFNNKTRELDDSFFIPMIKHVIDRVSKQYSNQDVQGELTTFALQLYTNTWLIHAKESEPDFDEAQEISDAREAFLGYYKSHYRVT